MTKQSDSRHCAHEHCGCPVASGAAKYCSAYCANADDDDDADNACACGHGTCAEPHPVDPDEGVGLSTSIGGVKR